MKKLVFEKQEAQPLAEFLQELELKNRISRLRNKLIQKLGAIVAELEGERLELAKQFAKKDEQGNPVVNGNAYEVEDMEGLAVQVMELFREQVAIEVGEYSSNFTPLFEYLDSEEFDMPLQGEKANIYDRLLDIWEAAQEENEEEK